MANVLEQQYLDLNNWTKNMNSFPVFENIYADGANILNYQGGGGYERLYIPISVKQNHDYTFKFSLHSPTGFSIGDYGHDAAFAFIRTSAPSDTGGALDKTNLAVSSDWDTCASEIPNEYTIQFNSGNYTTLYVALDFGYILDGVTAQFVFSNFALDNGTDIPGEYLRSIESDGTQYIDLNYVHTAETKIELECQVIQNAQRGFEALFGARYNSYRNNAFIFFSRFNGADTPVYNRSRYETAGSGFLYDQDITLVCYQKTATWTAKDGTTGSITATGTADAGIASMFLFDLNNAQAPGGLNPDGSRSVMRVYSLKIYEGETLVRHYLPALDSGGVAYLYEEIEEYAYYPAAGNPLGYKRAGFYLLRSGSTLYTITDNILTALTETELTASLFRTYGVHDLPDGSLLTALTDPEVLYWHDSTDELPTLTMDVKGTPPLPQMFTSEPMDMTHESISGIDHAEVSASEDVRFAISFDGGATWKAHDGSAWFDTSDTAPGMLASTMNAITAEQWAEVVVLDSYMVRFWLPNVTAYVASVVLHYINS